MKLENKTKKELVKRIEELEQRLDLILKGVKSKDNKIEELNDNLKEEKDKQKKNIQMIEETYRGQLLELQEEANKKLEQMRNTANASYGEYKFLSQGMGAVVKVQDSILEALNTSVKALKEIYVEEGGED